MTLKSAEALGFLGFCAVLWGKLGAEAREGPPGGVPISASGLLCKDVICGWATGNT
jgi:hypothetical protein